MDIKFVYRVASVDMFYVRSAGEPGAGQYLGEVRRIITGYRQGKAVYGWQKVGDPDQTYKRRNDAAKALLK